MRDGQHARSAHEPNFRAPRSIEEAESRLEVVRERVAQLETERAVRKEEAGDRPGASPKELPAAYLDWRKQSMRELTTVHSERRMLISWIRRHGDHVQQVAAVAPVCILCSTGLPQDRSQMYSEGWIRVRLALSGTVVEAYQCPDCSGSMRANVAAFLNEHDRRPRRGSRR
jgi:hypothetical protein